MSSHDASGLERRTEPVATTAVRPLTRGQKIRLVVKVVELRLRFVALMALTAVAFAYWETAWNRYEKWARPATGTHAQASGIEYYCPMHPSVVQGEPGQCPLCGMPLAKRKAGEKAPLPDGVTARVQLAPFRIAQAGVRTAEVGYARLSQSFSTVGNVAFDERRRAEVVARAPGKTRVESLAVNFTGKEVKAGEVLAELYNPELSQALAELRTARRASRDAAGLQTAAARSLLGDRVDLARLSTEKLRRWGLSATQVEDLLRRPDDYLVPLVAPIAGTVVKKNVVEGQEVESGAALFEIADLSRVWVLAQVYEHQIGLVHEGQSVEATVEALPGVVFAGRVAFIHPTLDASSRTVEVRMDLDNAGRQLRPGMFATVTLSSPVAGTRDAPDRPQGPSTRPATWASGDQRICPVTNLKLGSMGDPVPTEFQGRKIWTCCDACPPRLRAQPAKYLARLAAPPRDAVLSVPESAVIDTGSRKIVYVESEPGVYEGREVVIGPRTGDRFPVRSGLAVGEKVAAAGAFLIDAESRLNPATAPQPGAPASPAPPAHSH